MGSKFNPPNKYSSTPRKIFDKHVDRMETKRQRDREDHRADMKALIQRLNALESKLTQVVEHLDTNDHVLGECSTDCKQCKEEL